MPTAIHIHGALQAGQQPQEKTSKVRQIKPSQKQRKTLEKLMKTKIRIELVRPRTQKIARIVEVHAKTRVKLASAVRAFSSAKLEENANFWIFKLCTCRTTRENTCKIQSHNNLYEQTLKTLKKKRAKHD